MNRWHGMEYVRNQLAGNRKLTEDEHETREKFLAFRLKGNWGPGAFQVRLDAGQEAGTNQIWIENEMIEFPNLGRRYLRDRTGRCEFYRDAGSSVATPISTDGSGVSRPTKPRASVLDRETSFLAGESASPLDWKETIRRWQFLALNPDSMGELRRRQRMTGGPPMLNRDGSNLGQYLGPSEKRAPTHSMTLSMRLRAVLPYAQDLQVATIQEIERLGLPGDDRGGVPGSRLAPVNRDPAHLGIAGLPPPSRPTPPFSSSRKSRTAWIRGPIHLLVEEFRATIHAKKTQIIVTTHSPYLLDLLDLSHIVVVERVEGEPVFSRPEKDQLREWSKSFAPGRLYTMGLLTRES